MKISYLISINTFFSSKLLFRDSEARCNRNDLLLIRNFHVFFLGPIRFWSGNDTVINYVEVVLKITDNGAAGEKRTYCT